ncbi:unnamed protein product, partial [Mesorhabditis spiculigera]
MFIMFPPENVDDVAERQRIERNIQERIQARQRLRHHYPIDPEEDTLYEVPPRMPEINLMHSGAAPDHHDDDGDKKGAAAL